MQPPEDDVSALLRARADDDIALVRASNGVADITDTIVGFHAQQAAEKLLKAALARRRVSYPFTHDLERLLELVEESVGEAPPENDSIAALTPWAIEFRYGEAPEDRLDRAGTLALLDRLRDWVAASLD